MKDRKDYIKFLKWIDKSTYFFQDKDVTIDQVVDRFIATHNLKEKPSTLSPMNQTNKR